MTEKLVIPPRKHIEVTPRRFTKRPPGEYRPAEPSADLVPNMVKAGDGYRSDAAGRLRRNIPAAFFTPLAGNSNRAKAHQPQME